MKPNPDNRLEKRITHELRSLGDLTAPPGLAARIMRAVKTQAALPWYRRAWTSWPVRLQVVSILLLAAGFAGLCWLAGGLAQSANEAVLGQQRPGWVSELSVLWTLLQALGAALVAIVDHVGRGVILAGGLLILAMVAASACLGTAYVRFALNTARHN
jgi:hypothetical protein